MLLVILIESLSVAHFPDLNILSQNPYWMILGSALKDQGITIVPTENETFGKRWLWRNRSHVQVLHFHYVQQFFAYEAVNARLRWVLRLATNLYLARILGYRTIFTLHNATPTYPLQPKWVDDLGMRVAVKLTNSVIVHCRAAQRIIEEKYKRRKNVFLVPHPNFINQYPNTVGQREAREKLGIPNNCLVFAFVGGIRPNKGVEKLIEAFKQIKGEELRLIIVGQSWPPAHYIESLKLSANQDSRILINLGFIPDDQMQYFFNCSDVIVLPFSNILTSGSLILAMGFERPVVVPRMGCLPELVCDDAGFVFDSDIVDDLVKTLLRCRDERSNLAEMGKSARRKVEVISDEMVALRTIQAYQWDPAI